MLGLKKQSAQGADSRATPQQRPHLIPLALGITASFGGLLSDQRDNTPLRLVHCGVQSLQAAVQLRGGCCGARLQRFNPRLKCAELIRVLLQLCDLRMLHS